MGTTMRICTAKKPKEAAWGEGKVEKKNKGENQFRSKRDVTTTLQRTAKKKN